MKKVLLTLLCTLTVMFQLPMLTLHAQEIDSIHIQGEFDNKEAVECIDYVNEERALYGIQPLKVDEDLMKTAQQRAAEIMIDFDYGHYRPDGTYFTTTGNKVVSEIICAGVNDFDAYEAYETWLYSAPHHTQYMKGSFNLAGAARFTQGDGVYWVMHFGTDVQNPIDEMVDKEVLSKEVRMYESLLPVYNYNLYLTGGQTRDLSISGRNTSFSFSIYDIDMSKMTFTSSNEAVAKVDNKGRVYALSAGTTTINVTGGFVNQTINVVVSGNNKVNYILNGGENHPYAATTFGSSMTLRNPSKLGYTFDGWYLDANFKTKVTTLTSANTNVYAKWSKVEVAQSPMPKVRSTAASHRLIVQYKEVENADGYQVYYSTTDDFSTAKKALSTKERYISPRLSKDIVYYVKVRAYQNDSKGNRIYGEFSPIVKVTVK